MSETPMLIFINNDAEKVEDLFLNEEWSLEKRYDRIYGIKAKDSGKSLKWLVKSYDDKKYAKAESGILNSLKEIEGIPKVLSVGLSRFSKGLSYVILSEAKGVDLFDYVDKNGSFPEKTVKIIARNLLFTLSHIHEKTVHKDIKPENIVYDHTTHTITLIDFEGKITPMYTSPESLYGKNLTSKTDMWGCGMTFYFIASSRLPFTTPEGIMNKRLLFPSYFSELFRDFLSCLLDRNPESRYSAVDALGHLWLSDL